jgi:hypothetical protein
MSNKEIMDTILALYEPYIGEEAILTSNMYKLIQIYIEETKDIYVDLDIIEAHVWNRANNRYDMRIILYPLKQFYEDKILN